MSKPVCFIEKFIVKFSLRSEKDKSLDVEAIARRYGGGHKHAAGFRLNLEQIFE